MGPGANRSPRVLTLFSVLLALLVLGVGVLVGWAIFGSSSSTACSATDVSDRVIPSIVTISVRSGPASGSGSGEVIRSDGYILTNNHVIAAAAAGGSISVLFSDGRSEAATITGRDPRTDLAVIKVSTKEPLPVVAFGASGSVRVGQPVVVLGAPLGLASTVTSGIVSALDRTVEVPAGNNQVALIVSALQTDAAINPGNSGGAMTDCAGNLIGIPTAGAAVPNETGQASAGSVGLGFAIPSDFAEPIADEIIATGSVTHSFIGIDVAQIPTSAAEQAGTSPGLFVQGVVAGGPAAQAGLRRGDIITEVAGEQATDPTQIAALTLTRKPGDVVEVTVERDGRMTQAKVRLGAQPAQPAPIQP